MDTLLVSELCNVFAGISEQYPSVMVGALNLYEREAGENDLMYVLGGAERWPLLHSYAVYLGEGSLDGILDEVYADDIPHMTATALREARSLSKERWRRDLLVQGTLHVSPSMASRRGYNEVRLWMAARNEWCQENGVPERTKPYSTSLATFLLLHEYGHVVDVALADLGEDAERYVYKALERGVLRRGGAGVVKRRELEENGLCQRDAALFEYPKLRPGWVRGDGERRQAQRRVVGPWVKDTLGSYAAHFRDEIFAEAFALAHSGTRGETSERLAEFKAALSEVGLARRRTHISTR